MRTTSAEDKGHSRRALGRDIRSRLAGGGALRGGQEGGSRAGCKGSCLARARRRRASLHSTRERHKCCRRIGREAAANRDECTCIRPVGDHR
eukprot:scaffold10410_cov31-Tisochrysis_lutea.AAC.3